MKYLNFFILILIPLFAFSQNDSLSQKHEYIDYTYGCVSITPTPKHFIRFQFTKRDEELTNKTIFNYELELSNGYDYYLESKKKWEVDDKSLIIRVKMYNGRADIIKLNRVSHNNALSYYEGELFIVDRYFIVPDTDRILYKDFPPYTCEDIESIEIAESSIYHYINFKCK